MNENQTINYAFALKNYSQNGRGRSMKKFCEKSARHNAFMFSVIESCKMCGRSVERYLTGLLERLKTAKDGDNLTECLPRFMPA